MEKKRTSENKTERKRGNIMNEELNKLSSSDFWLAVFIAAAITFMVTFANS
jgi:hypothetical protein